MKQITQTHRSNKPVKSIDWGRGGKGKAVKMGKAGKAKKGMKDC